MYYEINVSLNGQHYFATAERSLRDEDKARALFHVLQKSFPAALGYRVGIRRYETVGYTPEWGKEASCS